MSPQHREKDRAERLYAGNPKSDKDFYTEVQKGNVKNHSMVHKYGFNDGAANGVWEVVSGNSVAMGFRNSAITMRVAAGGNAADDSDHASPPGAGAHSITIVGIGPDATNNNELREVSEAVDTEGAGASSATTQTFWRVYRAYVTPASQGTYNTANIGAVTIEDSGGTADEVVIPALSGQTLHAAYAIPESHTGYFLGAHVNVGATQTTDVRMRTRANFDDVTTLFEPALTKFYWTDLSGSFNFRPVSPLVIPEKSDVWFEVLGQATNPTCSVDFEILLVKDGI